MTTISLPRALSDNVLSRIADTLGLREIKAPDGGPLMTLTSPMSPTPVGAVRQLVGGPLHHLVAVSIAVPPIGLDSHMLFAFTPPSSPIPHFTVDSVFAGGSYAFHLDLIPRVDLCTSVAYMDAALAPLTEVYGAASKIAGLSPAALGPRQLALMSPWMLAYRADEKAFAAIEAPVMRYLEHWFSLLGKGLPGYVLDDIDSKVPAALIARNTRHKSALFDPALDPVWSQVARLIGEDTCVRIRDLLKTDAPVEG